MRSGPLKVLMVEDNSADAELFIARLRREKFDIQADVVGTAEDFEERVRASDYDVVLADYQLPDWTGMETLEILRKVGKDPPVIVVTGHLGDERAVECIKNGAADFVLKDRIGRLPFAITRALAEHELHQERLRL